jgi:outer membrane protein TolC
MALLCIAAWPARAQHLLTIEEAIELALENNHDIAIAAYETDIDDNNAIPGSAGLLPTVAARGSYTESLSDVKIDFNSPQQEAINRENARSTTYQASVSLEYNIFGGFQKFYRFESLKNTSESARFREQLTVENTLIQVISQYLEVVRLAELAGVNEEAVLLSLERYERAQGKYQYGAFSKLEVLNAQVDLNSDSVTFINTLVNLSNAKEQLRFLIATDSLPANFVVASTWDINRDLQLPVLLAEARESSTNVILANYQMQQSTFQQRIARGAYWPSLDLSAAYEYRRNEDEAGFLATNRSFGPTASLSLSYTLFGGFQRDRDIQNADIQLSISEENIARAQEQIALEVRQAFENYSSDLYLLRLLQEDLSTARLNYERSLEAYQTGQLTSSDLRAAQLNLLNTENRIINLEIRAKNNEVVLYQLSGRLIRQVDYSGRE